MKINNRTGLGYDYSLAGGVLWSHPDNTLPIIEKIRLLHADIYIISQRLSKNHKLGIHRITEGLIMEVMEYTIESAFKSANNKLTTLELSRVKNEVLKHIIRTEYSHQIITEKEYLRLSEQLVDISKMLNGWIKYITEKSQ